MTFLQFKEFLLNEVNSHLEEQPYLRVGQCLVNCLSHYHLLIRKKIQNGPGDCFYLDENIEDFWIELERAWETTIPPYSERKMIKLNTSDWDEIEEAEWFKRAHEGRSLGIESENKE